MNNNSKPLLLDRPPEQWTFEGTQAFRAKQVRQWIYEREVLDFDEMTNLPANLRGELDKAWDLRPMEMARLQGSEDTTRKFLWRLRDGQYIESVLIPATPGNDGERASRMTL